MTSFSMMSTETLNKLIMTVFFVIHLSPKLFLLQSANMNLTLIYQEQMTHKGKTFQS